jgi:hypothetical protein
LSAWEGYARKVIYGGLELEGSTDPQMGVTVRGVDYQKFKLFQMSLLWRAGVSSVPEFAAVELGPHEEKLRRMIEEERPGKYWDYGCTILFAPEPEAQKIFSRVIGTPDRLKFQGHHVYRFVLGMIFWLFPVSSHAHTLDPRIFSLSEDGTLRFYNGGYPVMNYLYQVAANLANANKGEEPKT